MKSEDELGLGAWRSSPSPQFFTEASSHRDYRELGVQQLYITPRILANIRRGQRKGRRGSKGKERREEEEER